MKYDILFKRTCDDDYDCSPWGADTEETVDRWKNETVVPRSGDYVFMNKLNPIGWFIVETVSFGTLTKKNRRQVHITLR
jgi:hypothetical protein